MPMQCKICASPERHSMEREYLQYGNMSKIAQKYGVSYDALYRHLRSHLSEKLTKASEQKSTEQALDLFKEIENTLEKAKDIFHRAYHARRDHVSLKALSEIRQSLETLAKLRWSARQQEVEATPSQQFTPDMSIDDDLTEAFRILTEEERLVYGELVEKLLTQDVNRQPLNRGENFAKLSTPNKNGDKPRPRRKKLKFEDAKAAEERPKPNKQPQPNNTAPNPLKIDPNNNNEINLDPQNRHK